MLTPQEISTLHRELEKQERAERAVALEAHHLKWRNKKAELYSQCPHNFVFTHAGVVPWVDWYHCVHCRKSESRIDHECRARYDADDTALEGVVNAATPAGTVEPT